jgi:hypothetical protein
VNSSLILIVSVLAFLSMAQQSLVHPLAMPPPAYLSVPPIPPIVDSSAYRGTATVTVREYETEINSHCPPAAIQAECSAAASLSSCAAAHKSRCNQEIAIFNNLMQGK